ncbi:amino acid ABC transporter permease, partial [Nocardioides massiliensis]
MEQLWTRFMDFMDPVFSNPDLYWSGFQRSFGLILWATVGSLVLGTLIAACRVSPVAPLRGFGSAYVTVIRNSPLTVVLFFFAFGLPEIGINTSFYVFGISALCIYTAAFVCEAIRAGINSVSAGQAEAARAVGMNFGQSLTSVILPQAFRSTIPPLGSVMIAMFKNSAVVGAFGIGGDLFSVFRSLSSAQGYPPFPVLIGVALGFLAI